MNKIKSLSISLVIPIIVFLLFICLLGSVFFLDFKQKQQQLYKQEIQYIKALTSNLQATLPDALAHLETQQINNILSEISIDKNLKVIAIIDDRQQILFSNITATKDVLTHIQSINYQQKLAQQSFINDEFLLQHNQSTQILSVYAPIEILFTSHKAEPINGLIFVNYSINSIDSLLTEEVLQQGFKFIAFLLLSLILLFFIIKRFISVPLTKMTDSINAAGNNHSIKNDLDAIGELGILQNTLASHLVTQHKNKQDISVNEQRLCYALAGSGDGLWDWDIQHDKVFYSERWKEMLGLKKQQLNNDIEEWEKRIHSDDLSIVVKKLRHHFSHKGSFFESTHRVKTSNGEYIWILSRGQTVAWDNDDLPLRIIGTNTDVSHYKKHQEELSYQAKFDTVTQLPNRNQLLANLEQESARAVHNNLFGAIIFIECNQYKTIHNLQEHHRAESLLYAIARRIEESKIGPNFIAHLSGSEFVTILPDLHQNRQHAAEIALALTQKLEKHLKQVFNIDNQQITLSCAFGIELFPLIGCDANDLLRQSTMALKFPIDNNFNNIAFFAKEIEQKIQSRHILQNKIQYGLKNNEFSLYFQPRIDANGQLIGAEALIRWLHGSQGWVSPAEFIPVAEDSALILPLGDWIIKTAFEQLAEWKKLGLPQSFTTLSINVSPKQLLQVGFTETIEQYLQQTKVDAKLIEIEITENVLLTHKQLVIDKLNQLRTLGLCFAIDDFGSGYSSFSYLSILPVSTLKIDQSFIENLMHNSNQQLIVTSIIDMAKSLNLEVVAEGIESEDQLTFLIAKGCTQFQGFLVGTPMEKQQFQSLLFKNSRQT